MPVNNSNKWSKERWKSMFKLNRCSSLFQIQKLGSKSNTASVNKLQCSVTLDGLSHSDGISTTSGVSERKSLIKRLRKQLNSLSLSLGKENLKECESEMETSKNEENADESQSNDTGVGLGGVKQKQVNQFVELSKYGWYWGPLSSSKAEEKLKNKPEGSFLVRDSSKNNYLFTLSIRSCGQTVHSRIEHNRGLFSFYNANSGQEFENIWDLISYSMIQSENAVLCFTRCKDSLDPYHPLRLLNPVSRFSEVYSLQYLSRFVIRNSVRFDKIDLLPLPTSLIIYIKDAQY